MDLGRLAPASCLRGHRRTYLTILEKALKWYDMSSCNLRSRNWTAKIHFKLVWLDCVTLSCDLHDSSDSILWPSWLVWLDLVTFMTRSCDLHNSSDSILWPSWLVWLDLVTFMTRLTRSCDLHDSILWPSWLVWLDLVTFMTRLTWSCDLHDSILWPSWLVWLDLVTSWLDLVTSWLDLVTSWLDLVTFMTRVTQSCRGAGGCNADPGLLNVNWGRNLGWPGDAVQT
jgi:hypothetical protein